MRIEINNISELINFIESAPTLSDKSTIDLVKKTTRLLIPFFQKKEITIKQLKMHLKLFGDKPPEDRPLFLCSKQKEFTMRDLFSHCSK